MLKIENLQVHYGGIQALRGISLEVPDGRIVTLIGANGAGKSTTLNTVAGLLHSRTGSISFLGEKLAHVPSHKLVSRGLALVPEGRRIFQQMTVQENLDLGAFLRNDKDNIKKDLDYIFDLFPILAQRRAQTGGTLSGGEKSRLRLCMLMGSDINFLILDEPTNHLDIASREWMEDALSDYEQTLLFVSHDRYFIEKFATRIWALADGRITDFRGGYSEFCQWRDRQEVFRQNERAAQKKKEPKAEPKKKPVQGNDKAIAKAEREIAKLEAKIAALDAEAEANGSDYQKLMELSAEREGLENELLELYEQWEELNG